MVALQQGDVDVEEEVDEPLPGGPDEDREVEVPPQVQLVQLHQKSHHYYLQAQLSLPVQKRTQATRSRVHHRLELPVVKRDVSQPLGAHHRTCMME